MPIHSAYISLKSNDNRSCASCDLIRLELFEFQCSDFSSNARFLAGFSEIEVLSKGRNVAFGKPVIGKSLPYPSGDLALLTDGDNYFGRILPKRIWMDQPARRHDLEPTDNSWLIFYYTAMF